MTKKPPFIVFVFAEDSNPSEEAVRALFGDKAWHKPQERDVIYIPVKNWQDAESEYLCGRTLGKHKTAPFAFLATSSALECTSGVIGGFIRIPEKTT